MNGIAGDHRARTAENNVAYRGTWLLASASTSERMIAIPHGIVRDYENGHSRPRDGRFSFDVAYQANVRCWP